MCRPTLAASSSWHKSPIVCFVVPVLSFLFIYFHFFWNTSWRKSPQVYSVLTGQHARKFENSEPLSFSRTKPTQSHCTLILKNVCGSMRFWISGVSSTQACILKSQRIVALQCKQSRILDFPGIFGRVRHPRNLHACIRKVQS
jgi:hypothetical protein